MKLEDVSLLEQLYSNREQDVRVYRGEVRALRLSVAVKEQLFASVEASNQAVHEALLQKALAHPNICQLYNVFLSSRGQQIVVTCVMEWMGQGNLMSYIEERRSKAEPFTESEIMSILTTLTDVFATAQDLNICHRDIKPQNIFRNDAGVLKVGDFGSSTQVFKADFETSLTGSPYFLSPLLKKNFLEHFGAEEFPQVRHDPFKSDMYSMGLTVLFLAKLRPCESLTRLQDLGTNTKREVDTSPYSARLKTLLGLMLAPEEADRPDFLALRTHLQAMETSESQLERILASGLPVIACVTLPLLCIVCGKTYTLDVSEGCRSMMDLYFCSGDCYSHYYEPAEPGKCEACGSALMEGVCSTRCNLKARRREFEESKRMMARQRCCYVCSKPLDNEGQAECEKCHQEELRKWIVPLDYAHQCAFCGGKWEKQGIISSLFKRKKGQRVNLTCGHRLCSKECFDRLIGSSRNCPVCHKAFDSKFLRLMKVI